MNTAKRIREGRIQLALSEATLAEELGISLAAYGDLEQYQDELATCVTLAQATQLSTRLGITLLELLSGDTSSSEMPSPTDVAERIAAHIASVAPSVEAFETSAGWEVQQFLEKPLRVAPTQPIMFFQDLAKALHAPPLSLIPHVRVP